ncbi:MAG: STAS domain-containing protein [Exiguobacterium chiriqhucha]|nr:MAG: STAS domain-containing protein [Exiguobacterium chiriqhucha]
MTWLGKKVTGQHNGTIDLKSGTLDVEGNTIHSGKFVIDMTSIKNVDLTDAETNGKLIGHLKSDDFFSVEKYPEATLTITEKAEFNGNTAHVKGDLTIKGITNPVEFDVTRDGQVVFSVEGPLFFGAIEMFEHVLHHIHNEPDVFIFNFHRCPVIDVTAVEEIRRVVRELKAADRRVVFAHLSAPVRQTLMHYGVLDHVDTFETTQEAIDAS